MNPNGWGLFKAKARLGTALLGQKQYAKAEQELQRGYEGLRLPGSQLPASDRERYLKEACEQLVKLYTECGKLEEAATWREKLK